MEKGAAEEPHCEDTMTLTIGIFTLTLLGPRPGLGLAWRFENANGMRHVSFGTREQVIAQAERQTEAWARLTRPRGPGAAMRAASGDGWRLALAKKRAAEGVRA